MTSKYKRKLIVYIMTIIIGFSASYPMSDKKYEIFFDNLVYMAIAFFVMNGVEHIAKAFKKDNGGE